MSALWSRLIPIGLLIGIGIGLTVATWSSAGLSDIPQANFGVAGATYNTLRQASYGLGVAVMIAIEACSPMSWTRARASSSPQSSTRRQAALLASDA